MVPVKNKKWVTLGEAAKLAKTSKTSIHRAIKSGRIRGTKLADGSYHINISSVWEFLQNRPVETKIEPYQIGGWYIPSINAYYRAVQRPNWLTRVMAKLFFQIEWREHK